MTEHSYIGTGTVARRYAVRTATVVDWMVRGALVKGRRVRLQHLRIGKLYRTTEGWLAEFLAACNGGAKAPEPVETPAEFRKRVARDRARFRAELARR